MEGDAARAAAEANSAVAEEREAEALEDQLVALGYVASEPRYEQAGVVLHDAARAQPGVNLVLSQHRREAELIAMDGETLHVWRHPAPALEGAQVALTGAKKPLYWRTAHLYSDGSLLAQTDYGSLT